MAYQALYRKYRPQTFSDVVGQEHITKTLQNELSEGKTVHAYLFTGTRGTGKTTCAKILANAVNCLNSQNGDPCLECDACKAALNGENTDIVEIDAASNNGVDSIRELREIISFAPASSKYRVYIIDEVHMLSIGAFNALLKTLEEPPKHVIFILATTEVHKLPATILSRCQRFDFRRIDNEKICERLQYVAKNEGLTLTDDAATLIAAAADGGMRDALSILDLCASSSKSIDEKIVENVCAMAGDEYLLELCDCIKAQDTQKALLMIDKLHNSSVDMLRLLGELISHYRDLMIIKTVKGQRKPIVCSAKRLAALEKQAEKFDIKEIIYTLNILQSATASMKTGDRRCEMEMTVVKLCNPELSADLASLDRRISALENGAVTFKAAAVVEQKAEEVKPTAIEEEIAEEDDDIPPLPDDNDIPLPEAPTKAAENNRPKDEGEVIKWNEVVAILTKTCPLIAGVLKDSKAYIKGEYLLIDAPNSQFKTLINQSNGIYKENIRTAAQRVLGATYKLGPYKKPTAAVESDPLAALADKLKALEIN
ncbi:MAG: DNA polymerase III subunit gamma/tau [Ruminococcaceae bacterium]|nr:DNA polymerase III subunit gamma/tau [Oscillospiraceae bacterium]